MKLTKYRSFRFCFIPGFMFGFEIPDLEDEGEDEFAVLVDLGIFRIIYESWVE